MIGKLNLLTLVTLLPATAIAQDLHSSHVPVSVPGKAVHAYRPIAQRSVTVARCHPEASKAIGCEAIAQRARIDARARQDEENAARLGSR